MPPASRTPSVAIVVLNWNGGADTLRCIASLERQTYPNFRILVVDNGSTDGSVAALRALGERITLIESAENLGYTGGNNLAIRAALKGDFGYIWLFNNDAVAEPDTLAKLVAACEADPKVGLASPFLRDPDGIALGEFCGGKFDMDLLTFEFTNRPEIYREWESCTPDRIWLYGTALLLRREAVEKIGVLDDDFFAYIEDNEISLRSAKNGFKNIIVTNTTVFHGFHYENASPYHFYYMARNRILLIRKHGKFPKNLRSLLWIINEQIGKISSMQANAAGRRAICGGIWDGLAGTRGRYCPSRQKEFLGGLLVTVSRLILRFI
jgi:GT2 family glycosyltransferase